MAQQHTIGTVATSVARDRAGTLRVTYHSTVIVEVDSEGRITLDSGGWRSATTKTRMNQASNQFDLGYYVFQRDFQWFVETSNGVAEFYDGMQVF